MKRYFIARMRLQCETIQMTIKYLESEAFKKDFKKLFKKFHTLKDDLETAKKAAVELFHTENIDNQSITQLTGIQHPEIKFYKLRKFACKALKGRGAHSGIRIIYAFNIEKLSVEFIEIYFKADQENEDRDRILLWLDNQK